MKMPLPARVAVRYLFARKSHSAVTAISVISICGIAVATAAIVCVLSVFNGFKEIFIDQYNILAPDVAITPAKGKVFADTDSLLALIQDVQGVEVATPVVADNALVIYEGREMPVLLKGVVAADYPKVAGIKKIIDGEGQFSTKAETTSSRIVYDDDIGDYVEIAAAPDYEGVVSIGVAARIGAFPGGEKLLVFAPRRVGSVNPANPAASFLRDSVAIAGVFQSRQKEADTNYIITDIDLARDIFQYDKESTSIEVRTSAGADASQVAAALQQRLGNGVVVKDRLQQQTLNFRMISIEKWVTFLLLTFILIVASFNIVSSLSMLILDKQGSLATLRALGASKRRIGAIFAWESILVTLIGCGCGIILGVTLCLLQQSFGFIKLAGDPNTLLIKQYPVAVEPSDLLVVLVPILLIGLLTALISAGFARARATTNADRQAGA